MKETSYNKLIEIRRQIDTLLIECMPDKQAPAPIEVSIEKALAIKYSTTIDKDYFYLEEVAAWLRFKEVRGFSNQQIGRVARLKGYTVRLIGTKRKMGVIII